MTYIEKEKLMELSQDITTFDYETKSFGCFSGVSDEDIAKTPTEDVVEVKHGEWRENKTEYMLYGCSNCDCRVDYEFNYCPNCGAKMDGRRDT